ncbi:hypothetical protein HQ524_03620 [Candidatus Uhrbacteria bacterium]|nr:hypothetical protein [Candidatus Uhrbacteria bacterium]
MQKATQKKTPFGDYDLAPGDKLTLFQDGRGFSLLADYREGIPNRKMMIKVALGKSKGEVVGGVSMVDVTEDEEVNDGYRIVGPQDEGHRYTSFNFSGIDEVTWDPNQKVFIVQKHNKHFTITDFLDVLRANHQRDYLKTQRRNQILIRWFLIAIFWLADLSYLRDAGFVDLWNDGRNKTRFDAQVKQPDPFFGYFKITRNMVFLLSIIGLIALIALPFITDLDIETIGSTGWVWVFFAVVILFTFEWLSQMIIRSIEQFKNEKEGLLRDLHLRRYGLKSTQVKLDFNI